LFRIREKQFLRGCQRFRAGLNYVAPLALVRSMEEED
jgi:hypothetical protein